MANDTVKHVIRFPSNLYAKLRKLAEIEHRSINNQVVAAIEQMVEQHERERGPLD
jgi:hypothetical protein